MNKNKLAIIYENDVYVDMDTFIKNNNNENNNETNENNKNCFMVIYLSILDLFKYPPY
jgi:hypothetical protein